MEHELEYENCGEEHYHHHNHHHHENVNSENEKKTLIVIIFTIVTMVAEIFFGYISNSMALLADGCHMGTHAFALGIAFFAYYFINKIQNCNNCDIVSGKISAFAGYTSSLFLLVTAIWIIIEAGERLVNPLKISFNEAILVAVIGLVVNLVCVVIMEYGNKHKDEDYNFKAAYLHILTDALTSVFAIVALFAGKYFGLTFLDPVVGFVGGALILKWSIGLIKDTSKILLDLNLLKKE
ncbi:MAG: cation diffusion facilitator family transporter [Candidatus Gastranaerophilaceae bacterium]